MPDNIIIKKTPIEEAVKVNSKIVEFDEPYPREHFEKRYKDKKHLITVAYVNDVPAGYIVWYDRHNDGSFYCWMAGVDPNFRRQGILKQLMDYGCTWAKKNGYSKIKIKTRNERREMLAYLVSYGFWFTDVKPYPNIKDNRIVLEKSL